MFSTETEYETHFSSNSRMLVQFICKPTEPVQWYLSYLQSKTNENELLDWLKDMDYGWATKSASSKKHSTAREWAWQRDEWEEEATKKRAEKKDEHIGRFKLFLLRKINTLHKLSCTHDAVYVHITCMTVTWHANCEGLSMASQVPVL